MNESDVSGSGLPALAGRVAVPNLTEAFRVLGALSEFLIARGYLKVVQDCEMYAPALKRYGGISSPGELVLSVPDRTRAVLRAVDELVDAWAGDDPARNLMKPSMRARLHRELRDYAKCSLQEVPAVLVDELLDVVKAKELVLEPPGKTPFAQRLFWWRLGKKLTRSQLAERLGVNVKTYANWEYGRCVPSEKNLLQLKRMGFDVTTCLERKRKKSRRPSGVAASGQQALFGPEAVLGSGRRCGEGVAAKQNEGDA